MRVLVAVPGNLRTVPMSRFVPGALSALGHEVRALDYSLTPLEKLLSRIRSASPPAAAVEKRLLRAIEEARPELFLTLYGANVSARVLAHLRGRGEIGRAHV